MFPAHRRFRVFMIRTLAVGLVTLMATPLVASDLHYTIRTDQDMLTTEDVDGLLRVSITDSQLYRLDDESQPDLAYRVINVLLPQGEQLAGHRLSVLGRAVFAAHTDHTPAGATISEDGLRGDGPGKAFYSIADG